MHTEVYVGIAIFLILLPLGMIGAAWYYWRKQINQKAWRKWASLCGLCTASISVVPMPLMFLVLALPSSVIKSRLVNSAFDWSVFVALLAGIVALLSFFFAYGKVRWLGCLGSFLSIFLCLVFILGEGY
ncbi:MAG TPA: hypothetical protein VHX63_04845 [Acidobacteriaceae bacterium]|jgi:hypothetical protein|nr:hypothetical protein [Acidobacteriaceae bacterium]